MRRKSLSGLSVMLVLILLLGIFPLTASAAGNEAVLTSINHTAALAAVNMTGTASGTLTVPYNYTGTFVDLSNGLDLSYNTSVYSAASASFPSGPAAYVNGDPITMLVTYQKVGDSSTYSTSYSIRVIRALAPTPTFSGTIQKSVALPAGITFTVDDFASKYTKNSGGDLAAIVITGSNPSFGALRVGDRNCISGETISLTDIAAGKLTFTATAAGTVSYIVKARSAADPNTLIGSVTLTITVSAAPAVKDIAIAVTTPKNTPAVISAADIRNSYKNAKSVDLIYVKFSIPSPAHGVLCYNYRSAADCDGIIVSDTNYNISQLTNIAFIPDTDFVGSVTIPLIGYNANLTGFTGKLTVNVTDIAASPISYTACKNQPVSLRDRDFNEQSLKVTGKALSYVKFTLPDAAAGKLYYKYVSATAYDSLAAADTAYNKDAEPYLSQVDFVPAADYTGTAVIQYTGYNIAGVSFKGEIKIAVKDTEGSCSFTDIGRKYTWALQAIQYLYDNDIVHGYKNKHFKPDASISKGDFIQLLCNAFDLKMEDFNAYSASGSVKKNDRYTMLRNALAYASSKNVKNSGKDNDNRWKQNLKSSLSRQDAMVLLVFALNKAGYNLPAGSESDLQSFTDYQKISSYAKDPIAALVKAGILQGSGGKFNPMSKISRAEAAVILYRALELYNK